MSGGGDLNFHGEMAIEKAQMGQYDKDSAYKVAVLAWVFLAFLAAAFCGVIAARLGLSDYYGQVLATLQILVLMAAAAIVPFLKGRARKNHETAARAQRALAQTERQRQMDAFEQTQKGTVS